MNSIQLKNNSFTSCFLQCVLYIMLSSNISWAIDNRNYPVNENEYNNFSYSNCQNFGTSNQDTIPSVWDRIDLTSPRMKQEAKVFPWWIPIAGGAAGAGALILILSDDEDDPDFIPIDDIVNVECGTVNNFDPTLNDIGTGINVVSITGESEYGIILTGNTIFFPPTLNMDFNITVNLQDEFGNTGQSTLSIIITSSPILVNDRNHVIEINEQIEDNVFRGSSCSFCAVESFEGDEQFGIFTITPTGDYVFIPNNNFIGRAIFNVKIIDECLQTEIVQITIDVRGENCEIAPIISTENTECGGASGTINIILSPQERYNIIWQDGNFGFQRNNLVAGEYIFRIIDVLGLCEEEFVVIIDEEPLNIASHVELSSANCLGGGEIFINVNYSEIIDYKIDYNGNPFLQFSTSNNPVKLHEYENLLPGNYTVTLNLAGRDERCEEIINLNLDEEVFPLEAVMDEGTTTINTPWQGNVLSNDIGTGIKVIDFESPINGSANISEEGEATFVPNLNFSGIVIFQYTIEDTCGNTSTALIRIEILSDCLFTVDLTTSPSLCGLNNGRASLMITPPAGQYMVNWSTCQTGNQINNLAPGNYTVTVVDIINDCVRIIPFEIFESAAIIVENITTENATCIEEGKIFGTFNPQYSAPFRVEVFFENESQGEFQFDNLNFDLQPFLNIKPGTYRLVFKSSSFGDICEEEIIIEIGEDDLPFELRNDSATININTFWNGNVLNNDSGTGLSVISFTQPPNGNVIIQQNGATVFTPHLNFVGETTFTYTVRDTCGTEKNATVFIEVIQNCSFTGTIFTTEATCGENDGSATIVLTPSLGTYLISWSSGDVGPDAFDLPAGQISVTVTDIINNCNKVFVNTVNEIEPKIVDVVDTSPAECIGGGNIFGTFDINYPGPYRIMVFRNGVFLGDFNFNGPDFSLDEFLQIVPGNYSIIINSLSYNPECSQRILLEVEEVPTEIITNNDIFQTPENTSISGNVLNNDIGEGLILVDISPPDNGSITFMGNGNFTYTPDPDFIGVEFLNYTVIDICLTSEVGSLRIVVTEGPIYEPEFLFVKNEGKPSLSSSESTLNFYLNNLTFHPRNFTTDKQNPTDIKSPKVSKGLNTLIHDKETNRILSATLSIATPINSSYSSFQSSYIHFTLQTGKSFELSRNIIFYSILGPGVNYNTGRNGDFLNPQINLSNGILINLNKSLLVGFNYNIILGWESILNHPEIKIYNKF